MIISTISHIDNIENIAGIGSELIINGDKYLDFSCGTSEAEILGHTSQIVENAILESIKSGVQFAKIYNCKTKLHKLLENSYNHYNQKLQERKKIFYNSNNAIQAELYKILSINAFNKNIENTTKAEILHIIIHGTYTKSEIEIHNNYYHKFINFNNISDLKISQNTVGIIIKYQQLDDTYIQDTESNIIEHIFSACDQENVITCFDNSNAYKIPQYATKADIIIIGNNMANGFDLFGLLITNEIYNLLQNNINQHDTLVDTTSVKISQSIMQKIINEGNDFESIISQMTNQMLTIQSEIPQIISFILQTNNKIILQITSQYKAEDVVRIILQNKLIARYSTNSNTIIISLPFSVKESQTKQAIEIIKFSLLQAAIITS
jgi:acetylornithine/succinyldiaminopimelate/putrescine aminotransferase